MVQKEERRRGRPRTFDEVEVLEKARAVFWDLGYAATSLDDIARATGLNRPSLYGAFGDKRALYLAAIRLTAAGSLTAIEGALNAPGTLRQVLTRFYAAATDVYRSGDAGARGCFIIGTAVTEALDDEGVRDLLAGYLADSDALFAARLERAKAESDLALDPRAAAAIAAAALHTLAIRARAGASEAQMRAVSAAAVDTICGPA